MYRFFGKLFVKDYKNTSNPEVRVRYATMSGFVGIVSNLMLGVLKIVLGLLTGSISIITDAVNNVTDSLSSVVTIVGYKLSNKGADDDHPFGHQRIEFISALIVAVLMFSVSGTLMIESIKKIISPEDPSISIVTIVLLAVSIAVKLLQGLFYRSTSKAIDSIALKAQSQDSFNDCISTSFVLVGSIIFFVFSLNLDGIIGCLMSIYLIYSSIKLMMEASSPLIGNIPDKEIIEKYKSEIISYDGIFGVHDVTCHMYGPTKLYMTAHAEVSSSVPILISHEIIDQIEKDFREKHKVDLTIHLDPIDVDDEYTNDLRAKVYKMLKGINEKMEMHDFRIVKGEHRINVIFDIELPTVFDIGRPELRELVRTNLKKMDERLEPVIHIDQLYERD